MSIDSIRHPQVKYQPIVLLVLDGWGLSSGWTGNAIAMANPVNFNSYWRDYPHAVLQAFKLIAGKSNQVSDSAIGHACLGTGRMIEQDSLEISRAIESGAFFANQTLLDACNFAKEHNSTLHLIGLLSDGGIHSRTKHLFALLELAKRSGLAKVAIHLITDGIDSARQSAGDYITRLNNKIKEIGLGTIATLCGRFYAMDKSNNHERVAVAYQAQTESKGKYCSSALEAIKDAYNSGLTDEHIPAYVVVDQNHRPMGQVKDNDAVIMFNFRADAMQQLCRFYTDKKFLRQFFFWRKYKLAKVNLTTLTDYHLDNLAIEVAFYGAKIDSTLTKIISDHGYRQLHVAQEEKKAHVSYFFNGGYEENFAGEDCQIIPSKQTNNQRIDPQLQAPAISEVLVKAIKSKKYDFILANYANADILGHTGDLPMATLAVQKVDLEIKKVVDEVVKLKGAVIITADHGNCEQMIRQNGFDKQNNHSLNPVPFILITAGSKKNLAYSALTPTKGILDEIIHGNFSLADVAPTILELLDIAKPTEMTGNSLLDKLK